MNYKTPKQLTDEEITTLVKKHAGKLVRVRNGSNVWGWRGNSIPVYAKITGGIQTFSNVNDVTQIQVIGYTLNEGIQYNLYFGSIVWEETTSTSSTKEEFVKELDSLGERGKYINDVLTYMEETGTKEYDIDDFKVYQCLLLLEQKNMTKIAKAKEISKLIKG